MLVTNRCPRRSMPADVDELALLFRHYKNGNLWVGGGVSDQPYVYLEAMQIISHWSEKLT